MSSLAIRLGPPPAPAEGVGVKIPLGLVRGGASASALPQREQQVTRAVAGALAIREPRAALEALRDFREPRADLAALFDEVTAGLDKILESVVQVQRDRSQGGTPTDEERAVADATGADPFLVSAAAGELKGADAATVRAAAIWVGLTDVKILETAAGVGARRTRLGAILTGPTSSSIAELEKTITKGLADVNQKIDEKTKELKAEIDKKADRS